MVGRPNRRLRGSANYFNLGLAQPTGRNQTEVNSVTRRAAFRMMVLLKPVFRRCDMERFWSDVRVALLVFCRASTGSSSVAHSDP